jgi:hypothetical protein
MRKAVLRMEMMAPEVGLEPTTLRLTGVFWALHMVALHRTFIDCK